MTEPPALGLNPAVSHPAPAPATKTPDCDNADDVSER